MPFGGDYDEIYDAAVRPAVIGAGLEVSRDENLRTAALHTSVIWEALRTADVVIVDVSEGNANVFYQLGIAQAKGTPTVLISQAARNIPFDLAHLRVLAYDTSLPSLMEFSRRLTDTLRRMIDTSSPAYAEHILPEFLLKPTRGPEYIQGLLESANKKMAQGNYSEARDFLLEASETQKKAGDLLGLAKTLNFLGSVYQATGEYDAALSSLQPALEILRDIGEQGEPRIQAAVTGNLANVLARTGDLVRALQFCRDALTLSRRARDLELKSSILHNLGTLSFQLGEAEAAEQAFKEALAVSMDTGDTVAMARTRVSLATVMLETGRVSEAHFLLERAADNFAQLEDRAGLASVWHNLASLAIKTGEFESARILLQRSLAIKDELGDKAGAAASLSNLALVSSAENDPSNALAYYEKAAALQEVIGDRYGLVNTLGNLGRLSTNLGRRSAAESFLQRALTIAERIEAPERDELARQLSELQTSPNESAG
jgi:tetratricopeptide (TPR) repeat protein